MSPILGIILARAGSKGLPDKNALPLAGRPLLGWTIRHARESQRLDHLVVSTDGQALAAIAEAHDVPVIDRPASLADDAATVDGAARHAVLAFEAQHQQRITAAAILYGNVPLRPADLTDRAIAKLLETGCDSVQSVCAVGKMHPYWMKRLGGAQHDVLEHYEPNTVYRRQDLPPVYMLDGGVIAVTRDSLFTVEAGQPHAFLGKDRRAIVTEPGEVVDVDSELDLRVAEAIASSKCKVQNSK